MDDESKRRFSAAVRALRGNRDREEFSKVVGVSRPTIVGWESERVEPKRENLQVIAQMRGESLDEFLSFLSGNGGQRRDPLDRLLMQIAGLSQDQLAVVLRAVAQRLDA